MPGAPLNTKFISYLRAELRFANLCSESECAQNCAHSAPVVLSQSLPRAVLLGMHASLRDRHVTIAGQASYIRRQTEAFSQNPQLVSW